MLWRLRAIAGGAWHQIRVAAFVGVCAIEAVVNRKTKNK